MSFIIQNFETQFITWTDPGFGNKTEVLKSEKLRNEFSQIGRNLGEKDKLD